MFSNAFQWHFPTPPEGDWFTVIVDLLRPLSQNGEVKLNSTDPLEQPNINLNFFSNDLDIIAMREGVRFVDDILLNGEGMKDIIGEDYPWAMPRDSDEEMRRQILERSQTGFRTYFPLDITRSFSSCFATRPMCISKTKRFGCRLLTEHTDPCGTTRLSKDISQGVVDSELKVHGVKNLRVMDASVFPVIPDCRIQNAVYMVAEKVSLRSSLALKALSSHLLTLLKIGRRHYQGCLPRPVLDVFRVFFSASNAFRLSCLA